MAEQNGLPKVQVITPKRKQRIEECWKMLPDLEKWRLIINQVPRDVFRIGENDRKWKANFDWLVNTNANFAKMLEEAETSETKKEIKTQSRLRTNVGYKKRDDALDNKTSSKLLGDILKTIL